MPKIENGSPRVPPVVRKSVRKAASSRRASRSTFQPQAGQSDALESAANLFASDQTQTPPQTSTETSTETSQIETAQQILALQGVRLNAESEARLAYAQLPVGQQVAYGLNRLAEIHLRLLSGKLTRARLEEIRTRMQPRSESSSSSSSSAPDEPPELRQLARETEVRIAVELAKRGL